MKFLIDRCAGRRVADWLRQQDHDVREAREWSPDPGDAASLRMAAQEARILVTIDTDFGALVIWQARRIRASSGSRTFRPGPASR